MRRTIASLLVVIVGVTACSSDDVPDQAGSPTATPSATATPDDVEPTADPTQDPTDGDAGDTTGPDDTTDDASTGGDRDADTSGTTDGDPAGDTDADGEASPPETEPSRRGGPASDSPSTPVAYGPEGSAFVATTEHRRKADYGSRCYLEPAEGEAFDECVRLYSNVNEAWMTLVEATDQDGQVTVTLYHSSDGDFTSAWRAPAEDADTYRLRETGWANAQDHLIVDGPDGHDVLAWDREAAPRLVAHLPPGDTTATARRIVRRTSTTIELLAVDSPGDGLSGTSTAAGSEEDVALQVYAAWVRGDRAAAEQLAVERVLEELFEESPASNDSFGLDGTDCPASGTQVACRFTATFDGSAATMTWTLGTVDGTLQVVRIDSDRDG